MQGFAVPHTPNSHHPKYLEAALFKFTKWVSLWIESSGQLHQRKCLMGPSQVLSTTHLLTFPTNLLERVDFPMKEFDSPHL